MAFNWWRKRKDKKPEYRFDKLLALPDMDYAQYAADSVDNMDPATRTHVAVAYENLIPFVSAMHTLSKEKGFTYTIEDFILSSAEQIDELADDPIQSRRNSWFLFAAIIARLEKIAKRNADVAPIAATIWTLIVTEYPRLKVLLPHNEVWSEEEKLWFEAPGHETDSEMMQLAMNHHIPPIFASHPIVERFAHDLGVFYWPSKSRIGIVP